MVILAFTLFFDTDEILWDWKREGNQLQIFVNFATDSFSFSEKEGKWRMEYRLVAQFTGKAKTLFGNEVYREKSFIKIPQRICDSIRIKVPKGEYNVKITVQDINTLKKIETQKKLKFADLNFEKIILKAPDGSPAVFKKLTKKDTAFLEIKDTFNVVVELLFKGKNFSKNIKKTGKIFIPFDEFPNGEYEVYLIVKKDRKKVFNKQFKVVVENPFFYDEKEYEEMVNRLIYIATPSEMKKLKNALPAQREKLWKEFWKSKDPTPQTEKNEVEEEYFRRIRYCEENFKRGDRGYLSDRARVYMKYGEPEEIEYHIFEPDTPDYQVWIYRDGKRFIFVDKHGFGEYILVYPSIP